MRKCILFIGCLTCLLSVVGQTNNSSRFKKENIYVGGAVNLGFGTGVFQLGGNPEIGYSIASFLDAGIVTNLNYTSISADYNNGFQQRSFNYGAGLYARLYPINFLFAQVNAETNRINLTIKDDFSGGTFKEQFNSNSILAGVGYGSRVIGRSGFYTAILFDLTKNPNSPYVDSRGSSIPIIRAGFTIYLRPGKPKN
jgi:hypothetical protein